MFPWSDLDWQNHLNYSRAFFSLDQILYRFMHTMGLLFRTCFQGKVVAWRILSNRFFHDPNVSRGNKGSTLLECVDIGRRCKCNGEVPTHVLLNCRGACERIFIKDYSTLIQIFILGHSFTLMDFFRFKDLPIMLGLFYENGWFYLLESVVLFG